MTIVAAADGSALGNPGPAGWAWYVDGDCWAAGGWPHGTNNMGELMAVLDLFRATAHMPQEPLHILCDSQYVINAITKWMPGWKRKGWRKSDGKPVLNVELLKDIDAAIKGRTYTFEWVKGHAGHELNEAADIRAREAATAFQAKREPLRGPGFPGATAADPPTLDFVTVPAAPGAGAVGAAPTGGYHGGPGQSDLFSLLEDELDPAFGPGGPGPLAEVVALERELLDPFVRTDPLRVGELLHPDFEEIGVSGRHWSREEMLAKFRQEDFTPVDMQVLSLAQLDQDAVLLSYRSVASSGSSLRSSLWLRHQGQWRLRHHQGTREG
ncbi:RNase H family protein [Specibacter sp. NPDC057265]|uniref:RNase H family protein n=1 Tax=Specibacter sp. NPDC057265 TaxID=3346075 RepID=UPI00362FEF4F